MSRVSFVTGEEDRVPVELVRLAHELEALSAQFRDLQKLWREEADRVGAVTLLLEANGCDCACDHDAENCDFDCDRCLACRISWALLPVGSDAGS